MPGSYVRGNNESFVKGQDKYLDENVLIGEHSTARHTSHPDPIQYSYVIIIQLYIQCYCFVI